MRYSRQRELIAQTVRENPVHPTADEVYALLKPENPTLSLGTVYRNLHVLSQTGTIRKLRMPDGKDRFDDAFLEHSHVICKSCGKIMDVSLPHMDELYKIVYSETGFTPLEHHLLVYGVCKACQKQ